MALAAFGCSRADDTSGEAVAYEESPAALEEPANAGSGFMDPNLATAAQLTALPGMSDSVTLAVIAGRPYGSMVSLDRILARHLAPQWRDSVYAQLWMPLDINTASSEEIMLIPGVDSRVRQELEEYRPFEDIEGFRSAIGRQLGPEDAARIERYITLD